MSERLVCLDDKRPEVCWQEVKRPDISVIRDARCPHLSYSRQILSDGRTLNTCNIFTRIYAQLQLHSKHILITQTIYIFLTQII